MPWLTGHSCTSLGFPLTSQTDFMTGVSNSNTTIITARGIMAIMVLCVIQGQGNSKILNLVKSGSFDSPIFLYIPNDEKTSTGHLI